MVGSTYASNVFDGVDKYNLEDEQKGWDLGVPRYSPIAGGDCFYAVMGLPAEDSWATSPNSGGSSGEVRLVHSRRFGTENVAEACSAVDILFATPQWNAPGGFIHAFEDSKSPTASPQPSTSTYPPTNNPTNTPEPSSR
jgi:hypothetical protein